MNKELLIAINAVREAGKLTIELLGDKSTSSQKPNGDILSEADISVNKLLKSRLTSGFPNYGWLSEETIDDDERLNKKHVWIIDPIDGTREFVEGIPEYVICIALVENGAPIVGVQYNPALDQLFAAIRNGGSFLNGKRIFCSESRDLSKASVAVSRSEYKRGEIEPFRSYMGELTPIGSVAYKLALVASGHYDINFSVQPKNEWDVCAGDLLIREAGGCMVDLDGRIRSYNQKNTLIAKGLIAGNSQLVNSTLQRVNENEHSFKNGDSRP
ncbi:MAG: 3'(2'),5'-bisphosphate nucleotidase CysQ [Candidatus Latescibacterota bacterium]|nr:3'(2'),5'-bisphosphate nucleotidase CysQ [Candidatus Latescibacterota bacterium]